MEARDLVGYGENSLPDVTWPNGSRLAVNFVINYEEGSEMSPRNGDSARETMSEANYKTEPGQRDLLQESVYEFGSRVGVWRILDALDRYETTATIFAIAQALEKNPEVARAFVARGYDMVSHGYRWVQHLGMEKEAERELIKKAVASIEKTTGQRPTGWFTRPLPSENTRSLLVDEGFLFDCDSLADDIPYYTEVNGKQHLVVPYAMDINDIRFWKNTFFVAEDWFQYARDSFDTLYAESHTKPRMMSVGLHARVIGRPGRIKALERFLAYVRQFPDVWVCNRTELANHWLKEVPAK
jgi:allantoinase